MTRFQPLIQKDECTSFISKKDDKYLSDFNPGKYQGVTELHDLILDPGRTGDSEKLFIFLNGWIFPTDAVLMLPLPIRYLKVIPPQIQVINKKR